jgi:hypothetical protein
MRNLLDEYAKAVGGWVQNVSTNALGRSVIALDEMRQGTYDTKRFTADVYNYWRDLADFRAPATLGWIPTAHLDISGWGGSRRSNFVQTPFNVPLQLSPVVNPETSTVLQGLSLDGNNGDNSHQVAWVAAMAGPAPGGPDKNGLFQGGIFRTDTGELIATVHVLTHLP